MNLPAQGYLQQSIKMRVSIVSMLIGNKVYTQNVVYHIQFSMHLPPTNIHLFKQFVTSFCLTRTNHFDEVK